MPAPAKRFKEFITLPECTDFLQQISELLKNEYGFTPVMLDCWFVRRIKIVSVGPKFVPVEKEMTTYYRATYAEGKCLIACFHQHQTVHSAAACMDQAGSYVVAVENGSIRPLTRAEEKEFHAAIYGEGREPAGTLSDNILAFRRAAWFKNNR